MTELQFNIGTDVYCADQPCGTLSQIVVDPESDRVEEIVVDVEGGLLEPMQRYLVPVEDVERASDQGVRLAIDEDTLHEKVSYEEKEIEKPVPGWGHEEDYRIEHRKFWPGFYGIKVGEPAVPVRERTIKKGVSVDEAVIGRGTPVRHVIEELGTVDHLLVERETGKISHLVMKERQTLGNYVVIPASQIKDFYEEGIDVSVSADELADLPRYDPRNAAELQAELEERLQIEATDYNLSHVEAKVDDGVVRLTGWVLDPEAKRYAEALALSTPGVIDVEDEIQIGKKT